MGLHTVGYVHLRLFLFTLSLQVCSFEISFCYSFRSSVLFFLFSRSFSISLYSCCTTILFACLFLHQYSLSSFSCVPFLAISVLLQPTLSTVLFRFNYSLSFSIVPFCFLYIIQYFCSFEFSRYHYVGNILLGTEDKKISIGKSTNSIF